MTDLSWFKRPSDDEPGTLNASYQLLDKAVVAGRSDEPALLDDGGAVSHARLLEEVAALGGVLVGLGVQAGDVVAVDLPDDRRAVTTLLAIARVGAVLDGEPKVAVTEDGVGEVPWNVVQKLGRTDPAPAAAVPADATWDGERSVHDLAVALAQLGTPLSPVDVAAVLRSAS